MLAENENAFCLHGDEFRAGSFIGSQGLFNKGIGNKLHHEERILVSGDFSGIQDTVYTISSKGALKSLRARSFMLELLTEHIVYEILKLAGISTDEPEDYLIRLKKTEIGIIYSGGGAFSLLLKNRDNIETKISDFTDKLNKWALDEFAGKLFIAIHTLLVSEADIKKHFQARRQEQSDELEKLKRRKFWTDDGTLLKGLLEPEMPKQLDNERECQITRRDDLPDTEITDEIAKGFRVSKLSYHLWYMGDQLTDLGTDLGERKPRYIYRYNEISNAKEIIEKKKIKGILRFPSYDSPYMLYTIKPIPLLGKSHWRTIGKDENDFFYAYYVRKVGNLPQYAKDAERRVLQEMESDKTDVNENATASFAGLAACSCGADMIGALRMDVDNLGKLFSEVSSRKKPYKELANRSHQLNYFFKVILNQICEGRKTEISFDKGKILFEPENLSNKDYSKGRNVSIVYAGGDDLFIIGAWNEIAELAFDIQKCFHQYCEANDIKNEDGSTASISGGLTLHHPKFPLYQMAKRSKEAEHEAKTCKGKNDTEPQKNRIALFHDPVKVQHRSQLKQKGTEREFRYMLSMSWKTGDRFLLRLMREFAKLGEFRTDDESQRNVFIVDKISHQSIEKCFMITEKFQQSGERYMPTMARLMADTCKSLRRMGQENLFVKLMAYLYRKDNPNMSHLHIALNWISFLRRIR